MSKDNKLVTLIVIGIFIFLVERQIERIEEKINFIWKDIGSDLDEIKEKLDALESEIRDLSYTIQA
jgi:hypothetical protein